MSGSRIVAPPRWLSLGLVVAFCLSLLSPVAVAAASVDLSAGDDAVIVNTNGDLIRLRSKPGLNGAIVGEYPEGTAVAIVDGPRLSDDGAAWYRVTIGGQTGYMAAEFLALAGSSQFTAPANPSAGTETAALPTVTGSATIVNTNGDAIRCRAAASTDAEILGLFYEGMSVDLTGAPRGSWQPVLCGNASGWVHTDYIGGAAKAPTPEPAPEAEVVAASIGIATIVGTNGDGVRCRSKASTDGSVITVLAEGTTVELRGTQRGDWFPVICSGKNGYVWAEFVSAGGPVSGGDTSSDITGTGVIVNTNGDGLRCRKKASFDGEIITVLREGEEVQLRGAKKGEWQPVYCAGAKGYVHGDYVGSQGSGKSGGTNGGSTGSSPGLQNGDKAQVSGTNGDGVRFRSGASSSASIITVLAEGTIVDVTKGSKGEWVAVTYRGTSGFVHRDYLVKAQGGGNGGGTPGGALSSGDHARVTETLNFRSKPSTSGSVLGVAMPGIVVLITGERQNGFFPVEWGGQAGYMHGDYLAWTNEILSPGASGVGGNAGNGAPSSIGQAMVDYAMNYLGYPYVWATAGPKTFDCSGFTYWVTKHVLGLDIGRGLWTQVVAGTPVSYGNLKPGDLVFFQNTYTWGLSHVGIYIGNNKFIHAENEDTGVRISDITSTYYSTRYYGAVRLG